MTDEVRGGVVQLPTGARWDPEPDGSCRHGNPNVLTRDGGTSRLSEGCTGQLCTVELERYPHEPPVRGHQPPPVRRIPRPPA